MLFGRYPHGGFSSPAAAARDPLLADIITTLRMPRVLLSVLGGCVLGAAGCIFQMMFSNPLVEPGFLGVSQGAAFGAAGAILFLPASLFWVQAASTVFALTGLFFSYWLASRFRFGGWILRLILAGIAVSALFASAIGLLKYLADPVNQLPAITFWLLGSLAESSWTRFWSIFPLTIIPLAVLLAFRWKVNILSLQDRTAFSLGSRPHREKLLLLFCATAPVAAVISISGLIGWVGLIVPHLARRFLSTDVRSCLPGSMLIGSIYLLVSDTLARTLYAGEIPLGILTSAAGALLFILILTRKHAGESL